MLFQIFFWALFQHSGEAEKTFWKKKKGYQEGDRAGLHIQSQQLRRRKEISRKQGKTAAAQYA